MRDINEVKILGTVAQEPRVNDTKSGSVANLSVVTSKKRGEYDIKKYHSVTCWNDLAQEAAKLKEGDRVFVSGALDTDKYEKNGQTVFKDKITAHALARVAGGVSGESSSKPQGGPPGSFNTREGKKSTFPYADKAHKVSWPKPDESGFSYSDDGVAMLCVAWTDPTDPTKGGTVYQYADDDWLPHGEVDKLTFNDDDIPF